MAEKEIASQIEKLENEKKELQEELLTLKGRPTGIISYVFLTIGLISMALSIVHSNFLLSIIGISLTFFGSLLLYVKPVNFIKKEIMGDVITSYYNAFEKILSKLSINGEPLHFSPATIKDFNNIFVFIPSKKKVDLNTIFESSDLENIPKSSGYVISAPGLDLFKRIENVLKIDFSIKGFDETYRKVADALVRYFEISKDVVFEVQENIIKVDIMNCIFSEVIERTSKSEYYQIGDPLSSALACYIVMTYKKPVKIQSIQVDGSNVSLTYGLLET